MIELIALAVLGYLSFAILKRPVRRWLRRRGKRRCPVCLVWAERLYMSAGDTLTTYSLDGYLLEKLTIRAARGAVLLICSNCESSIIGGKNMKFDRVLLAVVGVGVFLLAMILFTEMCLNPMAEKLGG